MRVRSACAATPAVLRLAAQRNGSPQPRLITSAEQDGIIRELLAGDVEDGDTKLRIPVPAFLITHPRGNVLFDTGLHAAGLADPWERWGGWCESIKER